MLLFITVTLFAAVNARQLSSDITGEDLWVASVDTDMISCDDARDLIRNTVFPSHKRALAAALDVEMMSTRAKTSCFIEFSGDYDVAERVLALDVVFDVDPDEEIDMFACSTYSWALDRSDQMSLPLDLQPYKPPFPGHNQTVYILDTGILAEHPDFGGRAEYGPSFISGETSLDGHGHGTHCASIAAGTVFGAAPQASIFGVKVLSDGGSGSTSGVIKGIQWSIDHADGKPSVLSLSLGGGLSTAMNKAVKDAAKEHIVVVAAGNSNSDACDFSPASAGGHVITVGSTTSIDKRSSFSNYGKCVDMYAPGSSIRAASIYTKTCDSTVMSGTSMATPHIAGLALQSLEKNDGELDRSRTDLLTNAVTLSSDDGYKGRMSLGQTMSYTGPPTVPTLSPTLPPTPPDPKLCTDECVAYEMSLFGPKRFTPVEGNLAFAHGDMCVETDDDFSGKVVLVNRGTCLFFDKVKNLEKQGALAVIIQNDCPEPIFPPAYYGKDGVGIMSCMVSQSDGAILRNSGDTIRWKINEEEEEDEPIASPTPEPTTKKRKKPCPRFKKKRRCKIRKRRCVWQNNVCNYK